MFTLVQQPAHPDGRGDTLPPTACLVETSSADLNRRDQRSNAGFAMGTSNRAAGLRRGW